MRLLLVEDDDHKRRHIVDFVRERHPSFTVDVALSYQSGLRAVIEQHHELVLLDMSVPTFDVTADEDGGRPQNLGGQELLRQLDARDIPARCVVITQFDNFGEGRNIVTASQLDEQMRAEHPISYIGMVSYDAASEAWKDVLAHMLDRALETS